MHKSCEAFIEDTQPRGDIFWSNEPEDEELPYWITIWVRARPKNLQRITGQIERPNR